jgi:proteasome accessory factor C
MSTPRYVARFARLPEVFELLAAHPAGLPLARLAEETGVPADELREDLLAFYSADIPPEWMFSLSRPEVLEFLGPDGEDEDPNDAEVVRIVDPRPWGELGVEYVDAAELALIYTAAQALHRMEPDNTELAAALDVLAQTMVGEAGDDEPQPGDQLLAPLQQAVRDRRRVRIGYSRAWYAGVGERVIEPYRLVQTRRGWEVDAGPADEDGFLRTFLLSNIRDVAVLDDSFDLPERLQELLTEQRQTDTVRVRLPQSARWAADMYAERVTVVDDGELYVVLDLELLPPLEHRVGLLMLVSGPDAEVIDPDLLATAGGRLASELLTHHAPVD